MKFPSASSASIGPEMLCPEIMSGGRSDRPNCVRGARASYGGKDGYVIVGTDLSVLARHRQEHVIGAGHLRRKRERRV